MKFIVSSTPPAAMIRAARKAAGMTQQEAADTVYLSSYRPWADYERGEYKMDTARWELFLLLTGQHPKFQPLAVKK